MVTPTIPQNISINHPEDNHHSSGVFKTILIAFSLVLLGVLLGVVAAKFFQPTVQNVDAPQNVEVTLSEANDMDSEEASSESSIAETAISITDWKNHKNDKYSFDFMYPPALKITTTNNKMEPGSLNVVVVNRSLETEVERNQLSINNLVDVFTSDDSMFFKKGLLGVENKALVAFYSLSDKQTLVITQYVDESANEIDTDSDKVFERIISTFKVKSLNTKATPAATESAAFKTPAS